MKRWLEWVWYRQAPPPWWLRPLARLYGLIARRRALVAVRQQQFLPVPVIVVGNVSIGGTGKTPCTLWLVDQLRQQGRRPAILSRGYGGSGPFPREVGVDDDPSVCGDEPVLMARRSGVPLMVSPDRVEAGRCLLARHPEIDVLVCDDGLQHYRLGRDIEFCVVDGTRGFGNRHLLPAGPLREPSERAGKATMLFVNGADAEPYGKQAIRFDLVADDAVNLVSGERRPLAAFGDGAVHAVAGIGNPQRYFDFLNDHGLTVLPHGFSDHHRYAPRELAFGDDLPVLMTEKDAVKCHAFAREHWWMVAVDARFRDDGRRVSQCMKRALQQAVISG